MDRMRMGFETAERQRRLGDVLWDLHAAGVKALEYTEGRGPEDFAGSELLQAFCRKMLELVADSLLELRRSFPEEFARVPAAERLLTVPATDNGVWCTVQTDLPGAVASAREMLEAWHGGAAFGADPRAGGEVHVVYDERPPEYEE